MSAKKVLVYGGRGALGSTCVAKFKELNWVNRFFFALLLVFTSSSLSTPTSFYWIFFYSFLKVKSCRVEHRIREMSRMSDFPIRFHSPLLFSDVILPFTANESCSQYLPNALRFAIALDLVVLRRTI